MNDKAKSVCALIAFVILTILGYFLLPKKEAITTVDNSILEDNIFVHIEGEIYSPGLKEVPYGTRIYELIELAGGETLDADLSRINLSIILSDEQKVVIPRKVEEGQTTNDETTTIVNINTASKEKLMTLPGVGESTAMRIIKHREENGYYNIIEDLMNVSGIGESKFNNLKDNITV